MTPEKIEYPPLGKIRCGEQVRDASDESSITGLAVSMQAVGQLAPIRVRRESDEFVVVDGERRWRAAQKLGWSALAVIVEARELSEAGVLQRQLVANWQRADLMPLDKARATRRLMDAAGWNAAETARQLGVSSAAITRLQALLALPETIQRQIEEGKIAASTGYELSKIADPNQQMQMAQNAATGNLTRDAANGQAVRIRNVPAARHAKSLSRARAELGAQKSVTVAGSELTLEAFIVCLKEALSKAQKAQHKGLALGTFLKVLRDEAEAKQ